MPRKAAVVKPAEVRVTLPDTVDAVSVMRLEDMVGRIVELVPLSPMRSDVPRVARLVSLTQTEMTVVGRSRRYVYVETMARIGHPGCQWASVRVIADTTIREQEADAPAITSAPKAPVAAPAAPKAPVAAPKATVAAPAPAAPAAAPKAAKVPVKQTKAAPVAVPEPEEVVEPDVADDDDEAGTATVDLDAEGNDSPAESDGDDASDDEDVTVDFAEEDSTDDD